MDRGIVMLSIGNKIFIPNYGAGIIKDIDFRKVFDTVYKTVSVTLVIDNMSLLIPVSRIEAYRAREIITKEELKRCLDSITQTPSEIERKWGKRYRENNDKIYSGIFEKECEVLRDLYYLKRKGIMPPGEQKILDKTEKFISSEIMLVLDISFEEALEIIRKLGDK